TLGHRGHTPVVGVAATVEDGGGHAGLDGPLCHQLADPAGPVGLDTIGRTDVGLQRGGRDERGPGGVVHQLRDDVSRAAVDDEAGPRRRAVDSLAQPQVPARTRRALASARADALDACHGYLPAFPTLRRTCSPAYRTPLPL